MAYTVNFTFVPAQGAPTVLTLQGPQSAQLTNVTAPVDVCLVQVPRHDQNVFNLTLTCGGKAVLSSTQGFWVYDCFLVHERQDGTIDEACYMNGSHVTTFEAGPHTEYAA